MRKGVVEGLEQFDFVERGLLEQLLLELELVLEVFEVLELDVDSLGFLVEFVLQFLNAPKQFFLVFLPFNDAMLQAQKILLRFLQFLLLPLASKFYPLVHIFQPRDFHLVQFLDRLLDFGGLFLFELNLFDADHGVVELLDGLVLSFEPGFEFAVAQLHEVLEFLL